jgi:hypothetical protein
MSNTIIAVLESLCDKLSTDFVDINSGGCCAVAAMFANQLPKRVVVFSDKDEPIDELMLEVSDTSDLTQWNSLGMYFSHVAVMVRVEHRDYILDSDGIREYNGRDSHWGVPMEGELPLDVAEKLGNSSGWNAWFDRSQLPRIEDTIINTITPQMAL